MFDGAARYSSAARCDAARHITEPAVPCRPVAFFSWKTPPAAQTTIATADRLLGLGWLRALAALLVSCSCRLLSLLLLPAAAPACQCWTRPEPATTTTAARVLLSPFTRPQETDRQQKRVWESERERKPRRHESRWTTLVGKKQDGRTETFAEDSFEFCDCVAPTKKEANKQLLRFHDYFLCEFIYLRLENLACDSQVWGKK